MRYKGVLSFAVATAFLYPPVRPDDYYCDFWFEFEGYPGTLMGPAGEIRTLETAVLLGSFFVNINNAQAWTLSLGVTGGSIRSIEVRGIIVPINTGEMDLGDSFTSVAMIAPHKDDPSRMGAISKIQLHEEGMRVLRNDPIVAKIIVGAEIPDDPSPREVALKFEDGYVGPDGPVQNLVTCKGGTYVPSLGRDFTFKVQKGPNFNFGFDGYPKSPVEGLPGETKTFEIFPTLIDSENETSRSTHAWQLSLEITGGIIQSIEVDGIVVDTIFYEDDDGDPSTPVILHEHYPVDLSTSFTHIARLATHATDPSRKGAISAVLLDPVANGVRSPAYLYPNSTNRIAKLVVHATVPDDEAGQEVVLRYADGFRSTTSQPVKNSICFGAGCYMPQLGECRFILRKPPELSLELGFEGYPKSPVEGKSGEVKTFAIYSSLTTRGNRSPFGPDSWATSLGSEGGTIKAIDFQGIVVSAVYDDDGDSGTPPLNPYFLDLSSAYRHEAELATRDDEPGRSGAISLVVLDPERRMSLQPEGAQRIARLLVEARVPESEEAREVVLRFEDGFRSTGLPRENRVNLGETYAAPVLGECRFTIRSGTGGKQVPGDSDQSGALDISDAVSIFGKLFLGSPERFPCGDGSPSDLGNIALLDWQPDGAIDISDGVAALRFLFLGGPNHHLAASGSGNGGCVPVSGCPDGPSCP